MSSTLKKTLNRLGLIGVVVGVVVFVIAGGDVSAAADTVTKTGSLIGVVTIVIGDILVFIREILN